MADFEYFRAEESDQFSFFRIPKALFTEKEFASLSTDAKLLYGILLDRISLSKKNGWIDGDGYVYIIYTIAELQELLRMSHTTVTKLLYELDSVHGIGLIERYRQGNNRPSVIYVKNFVKPGVDIPPSLVNIYQELHDDLGCTIPSHGNLVKWAEQGVLLLNTVLTVRAHQANSHRGIGWEEFTDAAIRVLNTQDRPIVFILWGRPAQMKKRMLTNPNHLILEAPHPSPLSAYRGFFGSKPFSQTNKFLEAHGVEPIDWQIEEL